MRYEIVFAREAVADLRRLKANVRAAVRRAIEHYLRHQPDKVSRSRIKRLRGLSRPQYRLRVGEVRIFYDVVEDQVQILGLVSKGDADAWLAEAGEPDENGSLERG